jgi:DNA polymerase III subunit delta'
MQTHLAHAYLLVGPRGVVDDHARRLAASIVADDDERALGLAMRGLHPDVVEFEPVARSYSVRDDVRARILPEAHRSPVECERKVIALFDAERLDDAANALLKTLEEPPDRTHFVLVTDSPDELLATVVSRCRRIDVPRPSDAEIRHALVAEGVAVDDADVAVSIAGGDIRRARALLGHLSGVRAAFIDAAFDLDGTGATVARHAELIQDAVQASIAEVEATRAEEEAELATRLEEAGYADRTATAQRRRLEERHKRAARRERTEAWIEGIVTLESVYRDALAPDLRRNLDREALLIRASDAAGALDACKSAREAFEFNPNELLLVEHLLLHLPAAQ